MESNENILSSEPISPLRAEHLKGASPIMACIGTPAQFVENPEALMDVWDTDKAERAKNIDFYGDPSDLNKQRQKNAGRESFVISAVDEMSKFSRGFKNCTGVVATGIDKITGKNISFLTHEYPGYLFRRADDNGDAFTEGLRQSLTELKEKCVEGTIDAVVVGGNYFKGAMNEADIYRNEYIRSINLLSTEIKAVLGFEPVVVTGPKMVRGGKTDNVFYDNEHRRLYIMREEIGAESTKSYLPNNISEQERKW